MANKYLESSALSAFCESIAMMQSAGIQTDEAVYLLGDNMRDSIFKRACDSIYRSLIKGKTFTQALADSKCFPQHMVDMVSVGEYSGRMENVLVSLARYYDEEDRLFKKVSSAITYPVALLAIMSIILLFTVTTILPVFMNVYEGLSGSLTASSYSYVNLSLVIGWASFGLTILLTFIVFLGFLRTRTQKGRIALIRMSQRLPFLRKPLHQLALGRFTSALATYIAAGLNTETSMKEAAERVDHKQLRRRLLKAHQEMVDPRKLKSLAQTIYDNYIFEPVYARMLVVGTRSGALEDVLEYLSSSFVDDSIVQIDTLIDSVEPTLAAFLTISVGATLIAVMLPLIGIMGSIG
ncbi:MAG: type II secretion system F family protein [Eggerthellaceae bacterium]|nr:type II secretion system F family protein [Eggerthellaceae bacterium]